MADDTDDKTEDPTQKRLDDALAKGDVAKSQEVNTWFIIAGATLILSTFSGSIGGGILTPLRNLVANAGQLRADGAALLALGNTLGYAVLGAIGVPLLMLALAAIAGNMIQHRLVWSSESLTPKFSKVSPGAGLKRIFGKQAVANFAKGVFKLIALGAVMMAVLWPERHRLESFLMFDPSAILGVTTNLTLQLMGAVVAMLAAVAIADYFFQYRQWYQRQKMSLQEIKDEFKQSEGDPHIKAKIRQLRQQRMKKRMMAAVPKRQRDHHQPDPLFGGAVLRSRHVGAGLRRQGRRQHRAQDPGNRQEARHSDRGERAAGARALCHRRYRRGDSGRALSRGRRDHRLRHGPEERACRPENVRGTAGNRLEMPSICQIAA